MFKDLFSGFGVDFFNNAVLSRSLWGALEIESLAYAIKVLPIALLLLSFDSRLWLFECKWFYNEFVNFNIAIPIFKYGRHSFEQIEKISLENLGPLFFYSSVRKLIYGR